MILQKKVIGDCALYGGDCLVIMPLLDVVDHIITDPPYGTTDCAWDSIIPLVPMWECINNIMNPVGAILLTGSQPFTSLLIGSNINNFRYELIYEKTNAKGFLSTAHRPLTAHENILLFGAAKTYNPQMWMIPEYLRTKRRSFTRKSVGESYGNSKITRYADNGSRQPTSVIGFSNTNPAGGSRHANQKPIELLRYLIKTYTNPGDVVLDFAMGSGTTGVACVELNRKFIGIEKVENIFDVACNRIGSAARQEDLFVTAGLSKQGDS